HPIIHVPNQLIGSPYDHNITLECNVEASPNPVTFWQNEHEEMIMSNEKYIISDSTDRPGGYAVRMHLTIISLKPSDIGSYTCVSKNSIGEVESTIQVYYIPPATTIAPRTPVAAVETNRVEDTYITKPDDTTSSRTHAYDTYPHGNNLDIFDGSGNVPWKKTSPYDNTFVYPKGGVVIPGGTHQRPGNNQDGFTPSMDTSGSPFDGSNGSSAKQICDTRLLITSWILTVAASLILLQR
ncbi:unnamed protein product, partial [Meganyctiphanes norvegica]